MNVLQWAALWGLPRPEPEYEFAKPRKFRFDAAWIEQKVAFEKEGIGGKGKSRHTTFEGYERDCEKYSLAAILGWCVVRATARQIDSGAAAEWVRRALEQRRDYGKGDSQAQG